MQMHRRLPYAIEDDDVDIQNNARSINPNEFECHSRPSAPNDLTPQLKPLPRRCSIQSASSFHQTPPTTFHFGPAIMLRGDRISQRSHSDQTIVHPPSQACSSHYHSANPFPCHLSRRTGLKPPHAPTSAPAPPAPEKPWEAVSMIKHTAQ